MLTLLLYLSNSNGFAQDYIRWGLPEGALVRYGKSRLGNFVFFPDSTRIAASSSIGIWIYDVRTGEELDLLTSISPDENMSNMTISPDGKTLAAIIDRKVFLWDLYSNKLHKYLVGDEDRLPVLHLVQMEKPLQEVVKKH